MPTYDYECQKCGHAFEVFQSMTEERLKRCPKCRGKVRRLFGTGAGIIFKGSGFYQTDYRSSNYQAGAKKETSAAESAAGKGGAEAATTDSKASSGDKQTAAKKDTVATTAKKD